MQALRFQLPIRCTKSYLSLRPYCLSQLNYCNDKFKSVDSCYSRTFIRISNVNQKNAFLINTYSHTNFTFRRHLTTKHEKDGKDLQENEEPVEKLSLIKRYKKMFKEYWYVLLPVHFATSIVWFGSFYYASTCGIDIIPFLEYINLPEFLIEPLRNSSLGHIAVASALYKLATPARYMVTLGGSTFAVNVLKKRGLIKPVPTKAEIKTIIQNKMKKGGSSEKNN